jgi:hypothetical protein
VILGGAAVHRCDNWLISEPALQFAEKLGFVKGRLQLRRI